MSKIHTEELSYSADGVEMKGFIAWDPDKVGARPAVMVVHEWWGCNEYAQNRARMLAEQGYTGFAVDLYGAGEVAKNPDEAGALMQARTADMEGTRTRFNAALKTLQAQHAADEHQIAAIGYCFGGGVVTHMARMGAALKVTGSFHGSIGLAAVDGPDNIKCRVMVYNGEADVLVDEDQIAGCAEQMKKAGAHYNFIPLPGAMHGFSNPVASSKGKKYGLPLAYNKLADEASWNHLLLTLEHEFE